MKLQLSNRLRACAAMICAGDRVADIGCDHGYLGISLLFDDLATHVWACDLREKPLQKARENAVHFGVAEKMSFCLGDGLTRIQPGTVDAVVIAGMGGDKIASILEAAPWVRGAGLRLILQPQSSANDLRRYLGANGYRIEREQLVQDSGFQYAVMQVAFGRGVPLSPGEQYCSRQLLQCGSELLESYLTRVILALERTVDGLSHGNEPEKLAYYVTALKELKEMREMI